MAENAEQPARIPRQRPHIGALATFGGENRVIGVRHIDELKSIYGYRACRDFHGFALARQIVGPLAFDFDRREARRHLLDRSSEARQRRFDGSALRAAFARIHHTAFGVVGVASLAPAHPAALALPSV